MLDDQLIQWTDGLFVHPQHLQAMQRQALRRHAAERRLLVPFPYGVVAAEAEVTPNRLRFDVLHAVLKDGTVVHHGRNATVRPVDLRDADRAATIHLAVRKDAAAYRPATHADVADEVTGGEAAAVVGRVLDGHLFTAEPDAAEWESLPVARLAGGRVDERFAPPCLWLSAARPLRRLVADVVDLARAARDAGPAADRSASRFVAGMTHHLRNPSLTPFAAYGACLDLLAVVGDGRAESAYDHDDLWECFVALHEQLAAALAVAADPPRAYDLRPLDPPLPADLLGCHPDPDLLATHTAVLAVAAERAEDVAAVDQMVSLRNLKVGAPGALVAFQAGLLVGWQVAADDHGLAAIDGGPTRFLALDVPPASAAWQRVRAERTLAVRYPTTTAGGRRDVRVRARLYLVPGRAG